MRRRSLASAFTSAFTLVELLVVVAIIVVLVALLLPLLGAAQASARAVACKSNLQQIGLAVRAYIQDNRGRFPDSKTLGNFEYRRLAGEVDPDDPASVPETYGWPALLDAGGYLKVRGDAKVWLCPAADEMFLRFKNTYAWSIGFGWNIGTLDRVVKDTLYRPQDGWPPLRLIWDNYIAFPPPPGQPVTAATVIEQLHYPNWWGPHRYGGKQAGPASQPDDGGDPLWADDHGCANVL